MMVAGGRINVDAGRLRVEAAGSDDADRSRLLRPGRLYNGLDTNRQCIGRR